MTFFEAFNEIKKQHKDNDLIIYEIIYFLSKTVKTKLDYLSNRNNQIDFNFKELQTLADDYFLRNKPLGQIIKKTTFIDLPLMVYDNILVPRNETEELALNIEAKIKSKFQDKKIDIADLCCGCGNLGIYLKSKFKNSRVFCIDINKYAIENTYENASKNNLDVVSLCGDYYQSLIDNKIKLDVIAMNPPYVDKKELDKSMTKYESEISFSNSENSTSFYETIINNIPKLIKDLNNFVIGFEIGYDQRIKLNNLLEKLPYKFYFLKDFAGHDRYLIIQNI